MSRPNVVLTCCRDEEDIVATFVRFYLDAGFDAVHVIDNGSTDGTAAVVRALAEEGLAVALEEDGRLGYERYLTSWYHRVGALYDPDWLFFLDCDEFILFPTPVRAYLARFSRRGINHLRLRQKEMYPWPGPSRPHFLLTRRAEPQFNDTTKDMAVYSSEARVYGGKHRVDRPDRRSVMPGDIFIRHYKYRTPAQAERKERNRSAAHRSYSDADVAAISAYGPDLMRQWILMCREAAVAERWRESFDPACPAIEDGELAALAARWLSPDEMLP